MGGGGRGGGITPGEAARLADIARGAIREAAQPDKRNVFISFVEEDLADVNLLRGQTQNENSNLDFNDWSVKEPFDSDQAEYIKRGIRERIRQSSVTLVYISDKTASSKWVDWEIRESVALGKGVIAVCKGNAPPTKLPPAIVEHKVAVLPWDQKAIARAIEQAAKSK